MRVYSVYDSKAQASVFQYFADTRGIAMRGFIDQCEKDGTMYAKHPGDFSLFEVGEFDETTQLVKGYDAVVNLGSALEFVGNGEKSRE